MFIFLVFVIWGFASEYWRHLICQFAWILLAWWRQHHNFRQSHAFISPIFARIKFYIRNDNNGSSSQIWLISVSENFHLKIANEIRTITGNFFLHCNQNMPQNIICVCVASIYTPTCCAKYFNFIEFPSVCICVSVYATTHLYLLGRAVVLVLARAVCVARACLFFIVWHEWWQKRFSKSVILAQTQD